MNGFVGVMSRITAVVIVLTGLTLALVTSAQAAALVESHGYIDVGDGVALRYAIQRPDGPGPFPTVLNYAGYASGSDPSSSAQSTRAMLDAGYAVVGVNVRGSGCSTGAFEAFDPRWAQDGAKVVEWIAAQPWSTGKVAMFGVSFPGITQLMVAGARPPHLSAIVPASTIADLYRDVGAPGGLPNLAFAAIWFVSQTQESATAVVDALGQADLRCPLNFVPSLLPQVANAAALMPLRHPFRDAYMAVHAPGASMRNIDVPALFFTQWQDEQVGSRVSDAFADLDPAKTWIVAGNGNHAWPLCHDCMDLTLRFLRWTLTGRGEDFAREPHVQLWQDNTQLALDTTTGIGAGGPAFKVTSRRWPPPVAALTLFPRTGGRLAFDAPTQHEASDHYLYPEPSGLQPPDSSAAPLWRIPPLPGGYVTYTSAPFTQDRVLFGASVDLWLSSTATDTDVQVTLSEVRPDGRESFVQRGWLRASHRALDADASTWLTPVHSHRRQDARPLTPRVPALMRVEVQPFSHAIRRGSRLRLVVDAPLGLTGFWGFGILPAPAVDRVWHDREHVSRLSLGVVAGARVPTPLAPCDSLQSEPCRATIATTNATAGQPEPAAPALAVVRRRCGDWRTAIAAVRAPAGTQITKLSAWVDDIAAKARVSGSRVLIRPLPSRRRPAQVRVAATTDDGALATTEATVPGCARR